LALTIPILLNGVEKLTTVMGLTIPHLTAIVIAITAVATIVSAVIGYFK
jgi:hypothetical protein